MIPRSTDGKQRVLSLSYGKDSTACLGAIEQLGWPLDRIITADIMATSTISAEHPAMVEFKRTADAKIFKKYGISVDHYYATKINGYEKKCGLSYEDAFYHVVSSKKRSEHIKGFPNQIAPWCNGLKVNALKEAEKTLSENTISYIGIAADEPKRLDRLDGVTKVSPLAAVGWTEADCMKWCIENGLRSPLYDTANRGGCWFCHNQGIDQLRLLRKNYPELWALLLKWDSDSPVTFKADGHTVHDFDERFALEDEGIIQPGEKFRWQDVEYPQLRWF